MFSLFDIWYYKENKGIALFTITSPWDQNYSLFGLDFSKEQTIVHLFFRTWYLLPFKNKGGKNNEKNN